MGTLLTTRGSRGKTHVNTALNVELETAFKAVPGVRCIVEVFVVATKSEPSLCVPCPRSLFKVAEGDTWVMWDMIRVCPRGSKRGAKIDRFRSKDGDWIWVLRRSDLKDERDRDLYET